MIYVCNICNKQFACPEELKKHTMSHTGKKPSSCYICRENLTEVQDLQNHLLTHIVYHKCDICGKKFTCSQGLKGHKSIHTGEKPYICEASRDTCLYILVRSRINVRSVINGSYDQATWRNTCFYIMMGNRTTVQFLINSY